jgi:predicted flavoprotein YhiN
LIQLLKPIISVEGKTTFKEEFVTAGGLKLAEVGHHNLKAGSGLV